MNSIPRRGDAPTTACVESEVIADEHEILVDPEAPLGEYMTEIGMYDASLGDRPPIHDAASKVPRGDRMLLERVQVRTNQ